MLGCRIGLIWAIAPSVVASEAMRSTMTDLLSRLQQASEGSRELSDEMLLACGWKIGEGSWFIDPSGSKFLPDDRPDPTRSLDDAVALVPEGWNRKVIANCWGQKTDDPHTKYTVVLYSPGFKLEEILGQGGMEEVQTRGQLASCIQHRCEPIACCIAFLKAVTAKVDA